MFNHWFWWLIDGCGNVYDEGYFLFLVVSNDWFSLSFVDVEAVFDDFFVVVCALVEFSTAFVAFAFDFGF